MDTRLDQVFRKGPLTLFCRGHSNRLDGLEKLSTVDIINLNLVELEKI